MRCIRGRRVVAVCLCPFLLYVSAQAVEEASGNPVSSLSLENLVLVWSKEFPCFDAVSDGIEDLAYVINRDRCIRIEPSTGKVECEVRIPAPADLASLHLSPPWASGSSRVLRIDGSRRTLVWLDRDLNPVKELVLREPIGQCVVLENIDCGVDDAPELIATQPGLAVVSAEGHTRFTSRDERNRYTRSAWVGDFVGDGGKQVLTAIRGKVEVFSTNGAWLSRLDPGLYATLVVGVTREPNDQHRLAVIGGIRSKRSLLEETNYRIVAVSIDAHVKWLQELPAMIVSARLHHELPWMAVHMEEKRYKEEIEVVGKRSARGRIGPDRASGASYVYVFDTRSGNLIATVQTAGHSHLTTLCWTGTATSEPLLLVGSRDGLYALRVQEQDAKRPR